jgi:hypothetical protein
MLDQLPGQVQDSMFSHFIFNEVVQNFRSFFQIEKAPTSLFHNGSRCIRDFYTWNDPEYRELMMCILSSLEPIFYEKGTFIYRELDEFGEINFIQKGDVAIGFEINK